MDGATAEHYATVYAALRAGGTPIPTNDMWIAASAIQHGLRLFTFDAHFGTVPGLVTGTERVAKGSLSASASILRSAEPEW